jgi:hypothetical protein
LLIMRIGRLVFAQEGPDTLVVGCWRVDVSQYPPITLAQRVQVHDGDDIRCAIHVIARHLLQQPSCMLQAFVEMCAKRSLKQANHRGHNPAFLNEINLPLKDGGRITVKADDEATLHLQPSSLETFHALDQVPAHVLLLAAFGQPALIRRLYADKDGTKPCLGDQVHQ